MYCTQAQVDKSRSSAAAISCITSPICFVICLVTGLQLLPTAYVVRREGNVFTRVCPSIHQSVCAHLGGGGTPARSSPGGYPLPGGGTPCQESTPPRVTSSVGPAGGGGTPPRIPPHHTWPGGTPCRGGGTPLRETDGVLDTPRSVCLLRSRRRTFLFLKLYFCSYSFRLTAGLF